MRCKGLALTALALLGALGCAPGEEKPPPPPTTAPQGQPPPPVADGPGAREIESEWGFDAESSYETLLGVLARIDRAVREGSDAVRARQAGALAMSYFAAQDRLRLQYDFFLQQPDYRTKSIGAKFIADHLQNRQAIEPELSRRIVEKLATDLRAVSGPAPETSEFVGQATLVLTLLGDPRALDIVLTDARTVNRMSETDSFAFDDGPEVFDRLAQRYSGADVEKWRLAHGKIYELMAARRRAGEPLKPRDPLIDMRKYAP